MLGFIDYENKDLFICKVDAKIGPLLAKKLESKLELPCKLFPQKSVLNLAPENLC